MKIKTTKTALEKAAAGVMAGVEIMWRRVGECEGASGWLHGAGMVQPNKNRELESEFYFLSEIARIRLSIEREAQRGAE